MKKYFYLKNEQQIGPFSYDELWNQKISPKTMVWYEGMKEWQQARTIPEFANWFPKQPAAQKRPQQKIRKPHQPSRPVRNQPVKRKKSYRGIIGLVVFLAGIAAIYYFWSQGNSGKQSGTEQHVAAKKKSSSKTRKGNNETVDIQIPGIAASDNFTKENFPLHPQQLGNQISGFIGTALKSYSDAKLLYMHPDAEEKFQYILDTYSEIAISVFFQGLVPVIKYQSFTSALVLFYNPWNDLVMLTEWQLVQGEMFIHDIELVTADFLEYDGQSITQVYPLWARSPEILPIEALSNSMEERMELFDQLWSKQLGTDNWRKILYSLSSPVALVLNQSDVAMRLSNQYLNLQYLLKDKEMSILRKPFTKAMKKLHTENKIAELLNEGPNTPDIVKENFSLFPAETWKQATFQTIQKVPEGAFVFVTTPKLTKTFLSFYYKFNSENELLLNRIDWCTFDNEL